ncbi:MAG: glycosyltransferase family 4 protein [Arcicella sp.]|jgi:glycosyltransferase involved in cell wall biosynthesis|nr:glycosyltransferase family 4 protein [Arcicella sp.]
MKVLFIAGGTPHYYNLVLNKLNQFEGIEVVLVAPNNGGKTVGAGVHQTQEGIEFKLFHLEEYQTYYGKMFFRGIEELIDKELPNIIISSWPYQLAWVFFPLLYWKIRRKGIKLISKEIPFQVPYYNKAIEYYTKGGGISEDNQAQHKQYGFFTKLKYCVTTEVRKLMVNRVDAHINYFDEAINIHGSYGVPKEKIFITANSPDTDLLFKVKDRIINLRKILPENPYRLIHVGRLVKWKRVDMLIDVTQKLTEKYPNIELIVVGTGPEEEHLKHQVIRLGILNHVRFVGGIYDTETLGRYFMNASIYVLAGMGGLSINEAMTFGLPVVCSVADGTERRLVRENQNGYYFENGNENSLYNILDKMLNDLPKTKQMGLESERIIMEEINIHTVLKKYVETFEYVVNK